jgi:nitrogen fixation NifU-like protein
MSSAYEEFQAAMMEQGLKIYSRTVMEHVMNPKNVGRLESPDGFARITGPCGDTMEVRLKVRDNTISEIRFTTTGCGTSIASGSMMTELAEGKSLGEAMKIGQQEVLDALDGLPEESQHCALLAADTLKAAVRDCLAMLKEPWKKAYRQDL